MRTPEEQMRTLTDRQLVALWNIVQMSKRTLLVSSQAESLASLYERRVDAVLTERGITHKPGKLLKEAV